MYNRFLAKEQVYHGFLLASNAYTLNVHIIHQLKLRLESLRNYFESRNSEAYGVAADFVEEFAERALQLKVISKVFRC